MSLFLYNISIALYSVLIRIASFFNDKANFLYKGRKLALCNLVSVERGEEKLYWFHVASLGEFEQGRPLIEKLKAQNPQIKILLTFFSPSGYEICKNYEYADYIIYLPADTKSNARRLIRTYKPSVAIFVKYEFWYHYLFELHKCSISTYLIAAKFLPDQVFFRPLGKFFRDMLNFFDCIYVQDDISVSLLKGINVSKVVKAGDTRFDRVAQIASESKTLDIIERFCKDAPIVVCGSTWMVDEEKLFAYINNYQGNFKWIIAPHEIGENHIRGIESLCQKSYTIYSKIHNAQELDTDVLIIDKIGILSSVYRYAKLAYIGGGFGVGIHNTLEAAVYGIPVLFGPNYKRFTEARDLIDCGASKSVETQHQLIDLFDDLLHSDDLLLQMGDSARVYVQNNLGATDLIISEL